MLEPSRDRSGEMEARTGVGRGKEVLLCDPRICVMAINREKRANKGEYNKWDEN